MFLIFLTRTLQQGQRMAKKNKFIFSVIYFELKEKPFQNTLFSEQVIMTIDANKWWRSVAKSCETSKEFCGLIAHLQACPFNSGSIERIFSKFSFVHTKLRNRLTITNVSKLVFCYGMLKKDLSFNDDGWADDDECAAECWMRNFLNYKKKNK